MARLTLEESFGRNAMVERKMLDSGRRLYLSCLRRGERASAGWKLALFKVPLWLVWPMISHGIDMDRDPTKRALVPKWKPSTFAPIVPFKRVRERYFIPQIKLYVA